MVKKTIIALSVGVLIAVACGTRSYHIIGEYDPTRESFNGMVVQGDGGKGCPHPPETFQESDLVGTWVKTSGGGEGKMSLILKEDGTYQQIYDYPLTGYHYESDWQKWHLEYRDSGTPHLHLRGMRQCTHRCWQDADGTWYDFCEGRKITFKGEVILLVTGDIARFATPPPLIPIAPRGIQLLHPQSDPDSVEDVFQLQR